MNFFFISEFFFLLIGPLTASVLTDRTGSYELAFELTIGAFVLVIVCMILTGQRYRYR